MLLFKFCGVFNIKTTSHSRTDQIIADKILILHDNMPVTFIGNLIGCIPLVGLLWGDESQVKVLSWFFGLYILTIARWIYQRSFDKEKASVEQIFIRDKIYVFSVLFAGILWGSVAFLFFRPEVLETFTAILLTLIVVISASMIALSSRPLTHAAFAIPASAPIIIIMFLQDNPLYIWSGFGMLIYMVISFNFSFKMHQVLNNSLELKYQNIDLVTDLQKQTYVANKANIDKSRFLAAASHDLRQPLHAVNLFVETLEQKITTKEQKSDLTHIQHGLDSLDELFNALLDITQLDSNVLSINKTNFSLEHQMSKWIDQYSIQAEKKQLKLEVKDCNHFIYTDPVLLEQVIRNLLSNAIRYTQKGQVDIYCTPSKDNNIELHIRDTGIGIPEKNKDDIFNEFYQLNNPERDRNKGLGLGLAIVKRISQRLNFQLNYTSTQDKGTEFIVVLSKGQQTKQVPHKKVTEAQINIVNHLKVMIVDNEIQILQAMENILLSWASIPTSADSTEVALQLIRDGYQPDIIITDYRMPGNINGSELIKLVQQQVGNIPGIILTGDTGEDVIAEIKTAKQVRLTKPLKPAQLRIAISHLMH